MPLFRVYWKNGVMLKKLRKPIRPTKNVSLEPIMSTALGNYEPRDLPDRSGPGEGGKSWKSFDLMIGFMLIK